jgi:hypothetical protein
MRTTKTKLATDAVRATENSTIIARQYERYVLGMIHLESHMNNSSRLQGREANTTSGLLLLHAGID